MMDPIFVESVIERGKWGELLRTIEDRPKQLDSNRRDSNFQGNVSSVAQRFPIVEPPDVQRREDMQISEINEFCQRKRLMQYTQMIPKGIGEGEQWLWAKVREVHGGEKLGGHKGSGVLLNIDFVYHPGTVGISRGCQIQSQGL